MSSPTSEAERTRLRTQLRTLSTALREAACAALARQSPMATTLDELRGELDRLLLLDELDGHERPRLVVRAQMMLDAWRGMSGSSAASGG